MSQHILIVEDDSLTRSLISILLEAEKYEVSQAKDGSTGLELLKQTDFDLVICDIEMPEMDGHLVLKSARDFGYQKPFIFLTGRDKREDQRTGMNLGADDYLTKPVIPEELLKCVETRLSSSSYVLAQQAQDLDDFKSFISRALPHEFRTPLGLISGYADILSSYELDTEQQKDIGTMIKGAASRLTRLAENYLLLSLNEANNFVSNPGKQEEISWNIEKLLTDVSRTVAKKYSREEDIIVDVQAGKINCTIRAIEKIVFELIDNAFKFSAAGESVKLNGSQFESHYEIGIRDAGRGMTKSQKERLSSFTQYDRDLHEQQGLGLGLEVVRSLVRSANGSIEITPLQKGLEVKVSLPIETDRKL